MNNDLISRSTLLGNIEKSRKALASVRSRLTVGDMEQIINGVRPVDAEVVRHGRWTFPWTSPECSACRKTQKWTSNYCPNCGAKMDAEVHDDA